jgi:hypothetical protein
MADYGWEAARQLLVRHGPKATLVADLSYRATLAEPSPKREGHLYTIQLPSSGTTLFRLFE